MGLASSARVAIQRHTRGAILAFAAMLLAGGTAHAQLSVACRLVHCNDGNPCTVDSCRGLGVCVFEPVRCDDGNECTVDRCDATGTCQHGDGGCDDLNPCTSDACSAGTCVNTAIDAGTCPDDGYACTDDACAAGSCVHVPIDSRCLAPGVCASTACAPQAAAADGAGCLPGSPLPEGAECAEDGEPCSDDVCRGNECVHQFVPDVATCDPVTKAFRLALVLVTHARGLAANLNALQASEGRSAARTLDRIAELEVGLGDVARTLAGKSPLLTVARDDGGFKRTTAQMRAIAASGQLAGVPRAVREVLVTIRRFAPASDVPLFAGTLEKARVLRRGLRRLKVELRRLQRVEQTFAP
jgi:hypothetical protein